MKLKCIRCGSIVSDEIPDSTRVQAWIECRDCVNKDVFSDRVIFNEIAMYSIKIRMFELFMKAKFKGIDMLKLKETIDERFHSAMTSKFTKEGYFKKIESESEQIQIMDEQDKKKIS